MEELNRLTEYVYANVGNPFVCNEITKALNELQAHIRTEVDELKIEHSDKCRGYFRHLNLMFHAGSGDLKGGHEIAQTMTMRDEINKLVDQIRSLEAEGKEQAK